MKIRRIQLSRLRALASVAGMACTVIGLIYFVNGLTPPMSPLSVLFGTLLLLSAVFFSFWQAKVAVLRKVSQETIFVLSLIVSVNALLVLIGTALVFIQRFR